MEPLNKEKLYQLLDIEEPEDFEYFENIAALLECEEEIEEEAFAQLVRDVDKKTLADLIYNYFEEVTEFVPDDAMELYTLLEHIKFSLMGMASQSEQENVLVNLIDEINRFRKWYSKESQVLCTSFTGEEDGTVPLRDALVLARAEKLMGENYVYDFSLCLDYPLEEYMMSFGDLAATEFWKRRRRNREQDSKKLHSIEKKIE